MKFKGKNCLVVALTTLALSPCLGVQAKEYDYYKNSNIGYSDLDESKTINKGDKIRIGTEEFYVVDVPSDNIRLLSAKNIDCTELIQKDNAGNLSLEGQDVTKYGSSNVAACINNYNDKLNELYTINSVVQNLKKSNLTNLGFTFSGATGTYNGGYDWAVGNYYYFHHHNTYNLDYIARVYKSENTYKAEELTYGAAGVRPFIQVPQTILDTKTITINDSANGTVDVLEVNNNVVTLKIVANDKYKVGKVEIKDSDDNNIEFANNKFTMSDKDITVSVLFTPVYDFVGENKTYTKNTDDTITFKIDADYNLFNPGGKLYIDEELVDENNYTSASGSTIITLTKEYMDTLDEGNHTLKVLFNNSGEATMDFNILKAQAIENDAVVQNPKTSDSIIYYISLLGISIIALSITGLYLKKNN